MATITCLKAWREQGATEMGSVTVADAGQISIQYPVSGITESYFGSFSYVGSSVFGTITRFQGAYGGSPHWTIDGLSAPASTVANALLSGNSLGAVDIILSGNDSAMGSLGGEPIYTAGGADTVIALDGNDTVAGGAGNDDVNGNIGSDIVSGGDGVDIVRGGKDADTISGDAGDDVHVNGNIGDDLVFGGLGNDTVYGGQDQDTLHGEAGADVLSGDLGADILYGETGADRFVLRAGSGLDWAADFNAAEGDRIQLSPGAAYTVTSSGGQVVIDLGGGDQIGLAGIAAGSFSTSWIVFG